MEYPEQANPYKQKVDSWLPRAERKQEAVQEEVGLRRGKAKGRNRVGMGFIIVE